MEQGLDLSDDVQHNGCVLFTLHSLVVGQGEVEGLQGSLRLTSGEAGLTREACSTSRIRVNDSCILEDLRAHSEVLVPVVPIRFVCSNQGQDDVQSTQQLEMVDSRESNQDLLEVFSGLK